MNLRLGWTLLKDSFSDWLEDKAPRLGQPWLITARFRFPPAGHRHRHSGPGVWARRLAS
jgi:hypothetical protein